MRRPLFAVALFLVIAAALRLGTGGAAAPPEAVSAAQITSGEELRIAGQVYQKDETSIYLKSVMLLNSDALGHPAADLPQSIPCAENIICELMEETDLPLGRTVALEGRFYPCSQATNPGEFDSAVYYRTIGIGGRLRKARITAAGEDFWPVRNSLYELKCLLKERLYGIFPEKEAAVMSALLLGDKKDLDSELKDLYKRNGILHILSISSLHITIIGMSVYKLLRKIGLPIWPAAIGGSALLLLYGGMTGFSVSACRAIGMYLIRMFGEVVGRTYDMLTALGVMGAGMAAANPWYLQNSGFLLSFSSVLGIGVVSPALSPQIPRGSPKGAGAGGVKRMPERAGAGGAKRMPERAAAGGAKRIPEGAGAGGAKRMPKGVGAGGAGKVQLPHRWEAVGSAAGLLREKAANLGKSLLQSAMASLSITLATLPVQLWFYYEIPVYSVFLNLFILPLMKPMMITGLLAMLVPGLGILGTVDYFILKSYELVCGCFDRLPFRTWNPGCPAVWQIAAYYLLLAGVVLARNLARQKRQGNAGESEGASLPAGAPEAVLLSGKLSGKIRAGKGRIRGLGMAAQTCVLCAAVLLFAIRPCAENSVTFLDVGQGDCILVRTTSGQNYLFDCGSSSRSSVGKYLLLPYLKYCGIRDIDAVFLSHPDADHINGAVELFETGGDNNITIGQLLLPAIAVQDRREKLGELEEAALAASQDAPISVGYLKAGDAWECGSARFICLHPGDGFDAEDINACSLCFYVEFLENQEKRVLGKDSPQESSWTMLLTGDVQNRGEEALQKELEARDIRDITILKAAHHGSKNSTPKELLEDLSPDLTVISSGRNNRYGHPHAELLKRLEESGTAIVQTALSGAVTVKYSREGVLVTVFCRSPPR